MNILNSIEDAKHVMIVTQLGSIAGASALYTHILRLHKKVSLVCLDSSIDKKLSFLPWFDKIKIIKTSSADFTIEFKYSCTELYDFIKISKIKINSKMATALYGGLLEETEGFLNKKTTKNSFAMAEDLIECGADYEICNHFIMKRTTLASLRLKALMLKNMTLLNSAKAAVFQISNDDLKSTGASIENCDDSLKEALKLPSVEMAILLSRDKEYRVLKLIYKEI